MVRGTDARTRALDASGRLRLTAQHLVVDGRRFPLADVLGVQGVSAAPPVRAVVVLTALLAAVGLPLLCRLSTLAGPPEDAPLLLAAQAVASAGLLACAVWLAVAGERHWLVLQTRGGVRRVLRVADPDALGTLAGTLEGALAVRHAHRERSSRPG